MEDKRDVRMLYTKHTPELCAIPRTFTRGRRQAEKQRGTEKENPHAGEEKGNEEQEEQEAPEEEREDDGQPQRKKRGIEPLTQKPMMILAYNKCKAGMDISDQLASYVTTLRKGVKWFQKLGIELLLGMAIVNALLIYKEVTGSRINIRSFRSSIARALLGVSLEQRRSPKQTLILTRRVDEQGKSKTLTCKPFYKKLSKEQGRKTAKKKKKKTIHYCPACDEQPQMCIPCFNRIHCVGSAEGGHQDE